MIENTNLIGVLSGGFDPIHRGHVAMMEDAKSKCDYLIVGLNSDDWLVQKKGLNFMNWDERKFIIEHIRGVDEVIAFNDTDGTAKDLLRILRERYPDNPIMFMNGGDRGEGNVPEAEVAKKLNIEFLYGVGGNDKANSSSDALARWTDAQFRSFPVRILTDFVEWAHGEQKSEIVAHLSRHYDPQPALGLVDEFLEARNFPRSAQTEEGRSYD